MAGAVPELASGGVGSAHQLWVGRVAFGWLLWVAWQTGLLYDDNDTEVRLGTHCAQTCKCESGQRDCPVNSPELLVDLLDYFGVGCHTL